MGSVQPGRDGFRWQKVPVDSRTVAGLLEWAARERPDDVFVVWEDRELTLAELNAAANVVARNLAMRGVGAGSRVALLMSQCPEYLYAWFGLAKLGAVEVPINTAYRGDLLRDQLARARVELAVVDGPRLTQLEEVHAALPILRETLVHPGSYAELLAGQDSSDLPGPVAPGDVVCVLYTSGTTGPSKGVLLSQRHLASFGAQYAHIIGLTAADVVLNYSPFFHVAAKFQTLGCLLAGARMVLKSRLSVERFWDDTRRYGVTTFVAVGGVCHMLNGRAPRPDDADNPVRAVYAVPAPPEIYADFERRFGLKLVEAYGSTETNLVVYTQPDESVPGSCGRPDPHFEVSLVDEADREVPRGQPGEITVRCADRTLLSIGYDQMPDETARAWRGGWFHTGDRAVRDEDGRIWFKDRIKDSIRRRGENISSYEVERLVNAHPAVAESAAVAAPSELGEDEVRVVVVLKPGASAEPEELYRHCAQAMPYQMVPRYIDIVPALPRTPTDKVEKHRLRSQGVTATTWDAEQVGLRATRDGLVHLNPSR